MSSLLRRFEDDDDGLDYTDAPLGLGAGLLSDNYSHGNSAHPFRTVRRKKMLIAGAVLVCLGLIPLVVLSNHDTQQAYAAKPARLRMVAQEAEQNPTIASVINKKSKNSHPRPIPASTTTLDQPVTEFVHEPETNPAREPKMETVLEVQQEQQPRDYLGDGIHAIKDPPKGWKMQPKKYGRVAETSGVVESRFISKKQTQTSEEEEEEEDAPHERQETSASGTGNHDAVVAVEVTVPPRAKVDAIKGEVQQMQQEVAQLQAELAHIKERAKVKDEVSVVAQESTTAQVSVVAQESTTATPQTTAALLMSTTLAVEIVAPATEVPSTAEVVVQEVAREALEVSGPAN